MANAWYTKAKEGLMSGAIDLDTAVLKAILVRGYTPNTATHTVVSDVTGAGGTIVATSPALTGVSITNGVLDANDPTFATVASGAACQHVLIIQASAVTGGADVATSAQRLIVMNDTAASSGLPVTPNGGDITVQFDNGSNKIAAL